MRVELMKRFYCFVFLFSEYVLHSGIITHYALRITYSITPNYSISTRSASSFLENQVICLFA